MSFTIRPTFITCLQEINESSPSEEPYVLVTSVDLTKAPLPTFEVFLYGAFEDLDEGETRPINGPAFWGTSSQPAIIPDRDSVIFIVTLMEQDNGSPRSYRTQIKGIAAASLTSTVGDPSRSAKVAALLRDIRDHLNGLNLPVPFALDDDHIGTEELRLNSSDLITSGRKTIPLIIRSREGFYKLYLEIDSLQPEAADCQQIRNEIAELTSEIQSTRAELRQEGADPRRRRFLSNEINRLTRLRTDKMNQLDQCLQRTAVANALTAAFNGTATVRTGHSLAPGPFTSPVSMLLGFNASRSTASIDQFTPIVTDSFDTPLGQNIATISMLRGGVGMFSKQTGAVGLPILLNIDNSVDSPFLAEDSTVEFVLTTGPVTSIIGNVTGSPLNSDSGAITLVGASTLNGGILGGSACTITLAGSLVPIP
jgi:hypothetical protein